MLSYGYICHVKGILYYKYNEFVWENVQIFC